jgi:hypothetical protein
MKRSVTIPKGYADAWARLFARSPAELEAERQSRQPAPAPRTPNAQEGGKSALQRTQAAPAVSLHQSAKGERKS